ncbi:hypothetical protein G9A89_019132 [Geosiphon pyriformis]|nr:hypothetical protein G9A89_019132 [Geosiphon pyriformis]
MIQIASRSSLASKRINVKGGIIDAEYTGDITVMLQNKTDKPFKIEHAEKIVQAIYLLLINILGLQLVNQREQLGKSNKGTQELLKLALKENLLFLPIDIPPNATIQQKFQQCLNEKNSEYPPIYRYFHIEKTLHEQKLELITTNLTKEAIQKQLHNEFKTTAGPINSCYKFRAAFRLYDLFHTCENILQNPILQPLKIQYIGKLTELKFQQFSDQISSVILDYYLEHIDITWTLMELSLEEEVMLPTKI